MTPRKFRWRWPYKEERRQQLDDLARAMRLRNLKGKGSGARRLAIMRRTGIDPVENQ